MYNTTAKQFFETQLPTWLKAAPADMKGVVQFTIEGQGGAVWWVDFAKKTVSPGAETGAPKFTALVRAQERDFMALVEGRMSPADGLLTQRLHLAGEATAIAQLTDAFAKLAKLAT